MDLELNGEGGSGGSTSACSDQLFDACGAEPVLDLPHGGVVGRRSLALARSRSCARAGGRGGGVGRGCRTGRARRRNRSSTAPGAAEPAARRSGRRPAVAPVWCAGCRPLSWVSTVMSRSEVAVAGRGQVTRRASSRVQRERLRYEPHRTTNPASRMTPRLSRPRPEAHRRQHGERRCWIPLAVH